MTAAWYALWTRSRHEQAVRQQLDQKGYEAFLPTLGLWRRWKDRRLVLAVDLIGQAVSVEVDAADIKSC